jgi:hypothetical protein
VLRVVGTHCAELEISLLENEQVVVIVTR